MDHTNGPWSPRWNGKRARRTRLINLKVRATLPHGEWVDRQAALYRVAEHCPVHETITTVQGIDFEIVGAVDEISLWLAASTCAPTTPPRLRSRSLGPRRAIGSTRARSSRPRSPTTRRGAVVCPARPLSPAPPVPPAHETTPVPPHGLAPRLTAIPPGATCPALHRWR